MTRRIQAGRVAFAAAVAVSLVAGAQSAFARPAPAAAQSAVTCYPGHCHRECQSYGWRTGQCIGGYEGYCECYE
ncbi:MAG TPA: hypothetical protein VLK84_07560 [Longimicrobium sp.]|nr:hypothetical protein [Longimicrobium sp.]